MTDKAPMGTLICDPPPGRITILSVPGRLGHDELERIRVQWDEAMRTGKAVVLDSSITVHFAGSYGWPDWEHTAA